MKKSIILKKIIKLRKITKLSIEVCKKSLIINNYNIKKAFNYIIINNKDLIEKINFNKKLNNGIVYTKVNKKKNIGILLKIKTESDYILKNKYFKFFLKKIIKIIFKYKINNLKLLLNNKKIKFLIFKIMLFFKEKILIDKLFYFHDYFIDYYNHYNNKITSVVCFKKKTNKKNILKISKYIAMFIVAKNIKCKNINNYFISKNILNDNFFLKKINLNKKKYLFFFKKNIYIKKYKLLYI
ncbi:MAG: hypothetical protein NHF95_00895 [Candidatus Shikimatogenerans sp. JK-2022]|nr:hypothetical protein [Candidatus Shikimatogenerans bostrichidophilus]